MVDQLSYQTNHRLFLKKHRIHHEIYLYVYSIVLVYGCLMSPSPIHSLERFTPSERVSASEE